MQQKRWLQFQSILVRNENLSPKLLSLDFWQNFTHAIFSILHFPKNWAFTYYFLLAPNAKEPNIQSKNCLLFCFDSVRLRPYKFRCKRRKRIESVEILIENYNMQYANTVFKELELRERFHWVQWVGWDAWTRWTQ